MKHKDRALNIKIGQRIRFYRENAGLSRETLAERIGITVRFLADVERGRVGLSISNLCKVSQILGVTTDALLWGTPEPSPPAEQAATMLSNVSPELAGKIVELIRGQLELVDLAQRAEQKEE